MNIKRTLRAQASFTSDQVDKVLKLYEQCSSPASREMIFGHGEIRAKFQAMRLAIDEARERADNSGPEGVPGSPGPGLL